jgi:short-subunit dehydrogenase
MNASSRPSVLITGASSGLGRQMAIEFARRGYDLSLSARRRDVVEELADQLRRDHGCTVHTAALDVTDGVAVEHAIQEAAEALGGLDRVVANAGIGHSGPIGKLPFEQVKATIETNVIGLMATVDAAVRLFKEQGKGHIVGISSVAGFRGLPSGGAYSASKAAVTAYFQALAAEQHGKSITTTLLSPGYIDTPIKQSAPSRPFCIPVEKGGRILVDLIEAEVRTACVPRWPWGLLARVLAHLPTAVIAKMA